MADTARVTANFAEVLVGPPVTARVTAVFAEVLAQDAQAARVTAAMLEVMSASSNPVLVTAAMLEVMALKLEETIESALADGVIAADAESHPLRVTRDAAHTVSMTSALETYRYITRSASDTTNVVPTTTELVRRTAVVSESLTVQFAQARTYIASVIRGDTLVVTPTDAVAFPVTASDGVAVSSVATAAMALAVLDALQLTELLAPVQRFGQVATDTVYLSDALRRFLSLGLSDAVNVVPTATRLFRSQPHLTETVALTSTLTPYFAIAALCDDTIALTHTDALKLLFAPALQDGLVVQAAYIAPGDTLLTWSINARTGAVTEYQDYAFNSFARHGQRYLGASRDGVFYLDGETDAGADIISRMASGFLQFGGSRFSSIKAVYLGIHGSGDVYFKIESPTGGVTTYKTVIQDQQTTKVQVGKGLRARYFAYELISTGGDFDLDSVEFVPLVAQRRV